MKNTVAPFPLPMVLLVVFIILKLCHVIDWSWWWVMSPLWIAVGVALLLCFWVFVVAVISEAKK